MKINIINHKYLISIVLFIKILTGSHFGYSQDKINSIINFDFIFSNTGYEFWTEENTCCFQYKVADEIEWRSIRTVDTIMNYTIKRLEENNNLSIIPVKVGSVKRNSFNKLTGFPGMSLKEAVWQGNYNHMFSIQVTVSSMEKPFYHWYYPKVVNQADEVVSIINDSNKANRRSRVPETNTDMVIKITEYDSTGKKVAEYKNRTRMRDLDGSYVLKTGHDDYWSLCGNDFFEYYAEAFENSLKCEKK